MGCAAQLAQAAECETSSARADSEGSAGPGRRAEGRPGLRKRRAVSGPVQPTCVVLEPEPEGELASRDDEEVSGGAHLVVSVAVAKRAISPPALKAQILLSRKC